MKKSYELQVFSLPNLFRKGKLIGLMLFIFGALHAQEIVKGIVRDDKGSPLPGVYIESESGQSTETDAKGSYQINAEIGQMLTFSQTGFESQKIIISDKILNVTLTSGIKLNEVVVVGSRNPARTAIDTPVPVDVIDIQGLITQNPQVNLNQILNYVAPSFTSNTQTIADGTDHVDPASLRGLGPDQVLVLINGKRRHKSSLINVNGTFGRGSVGTDLNAIPTASIKRIEVLRDGAAAQYGSDAIAGVINIVLKNSVDQLQLNVTSGANFSRYANEQTGGVDGATTNISANYGLSLGNKGGFINFTGDFDYRQPTNRMKQYEGNIFNAYNAIENVANADGYDIANLFTDVDAIKKYGNKVSYFSSNLKSSIQNASAIEDLQDILKTDVTEQELEARGLKRSDFNMRIGQSKLRGGRFFMNMAIPLDDKGSEFYSFAGMSARSGNAAGFYRLPNQNRTYTPTYINGFLPEINSKIKDQSIALGIKGLIDNWNVDFSNTLGRNSFMYEISNTSNASMLSNSPTHFDAGGFSFLENTVNLDIDRLYKNIFNGLNVAFGAEYRFENYKIVAGSESSYAQYDESGKPIVEDSQKPTTDFFGNPRPGGAQVFPGYRPANELSRERNSIAGYFDLEADFTKKFLLDFATRYENYSDFGSTLNFKAASRYKITDNFNLRAALSTGFRAPSLPQLYYNSTSTLFVDGIPYEVGTFSNDSRIAKLLGIPKLKQEKSRNVSVGFTAKIPNTNLSFTVDGYFVAIDDRVVYTGNFSPTTPELQRLFNRANATRAAFLANAIDTESKGIDVVITHKAYLGNNMKLKNDLSATFSQTRKVGPVKASPILKKAGLTEVYFDNSSRIFLEESVPRAKINLSNSLTTSRFNVFLRNVFFGKVTESTNSAENMQTFSPKVVTDLSFGYKLTDALLLTLGANNLFDVYPDKLIEANRSQGRFDWSRRSQQFGISGRFLFARLSLNL